MQECEVIKINIGKGPFEQSFRDVDIALENRVICCGVRWTEAEKREKEREGERNSEREFCCFNSSIFQGTG